MANLNVPQIFIAHANEDKSAVRGLYDRLKQSGYEPWLDEKDLLPGQNGRDEIPKALKKSDFFLMCLSLQSINKKGYVQREFKQAINLLAEMPTGTIYLIPLKLDDCEIPDLRQNEYGINLRDLQWLNYWEPDSYEKLIKSIQYQCNQQKNMLPEGNLNSLPKNFNQFNSDGDNVAGDKVTGDKILGNKIVNNFHSEHQNKPVIVPKNAEIEPTLFSKTFQEKKLIRLESDFNSLEKLYQELDQKVKKLEGDMNFAEPIARLNLERHIERDKKQLLEYSIRLDKLACDIETLDKNY